MKTQGHITNCSLPLAGQCAFVPAAFEGFYFGKPQTAITMNKRHPVKSFRPAMSLGDDDWTHPGKGGA